MYPHPLGLPPSQWTLLPLVLALLCVLPPPTLHSQSLTPEQIEKIEQELSKIEAEVEGSRLSTRSSAVSAFQKAAANDKAALDFYLACFKEVRFDRQSARASDFRDWREKNEARLKEKGNLAALRLQLQYLVLTLRAAEGGPLDTLVPELESFAAGIVNNITSLEDDGLRRLREPVNNTIFAEAYGLDKTLKLEKWSFTPGNFSSIYDRAVLPYFQNSKPDLLPAAWDRRIKLETEYAAAVEIENPAALNTFKTETLPQLQFEKSTDIFRHNSQQQGALAVIALLKAHPSHPKAGEWLVQFREMLTRSMTAAIPSPATGTQTTP